MQTAVHSARPRISFRPTWNKAIRGYAYNLTRSFWPKLRRYYAWEDLAQEAYLTFERCAHRYSGKVDNEVWFVALFKTAWYQRLLALSARTPRGLLDSVAESSEYLQELVLWDLCRPDSHCKFSRVARAYTHVAAGEGK